METLPAEIVEKVGQHLTPQDLARCCAVSLQWREIFDQDRLWKLHCDPELEEPLRTTPSTVEPVFVSPEDENSTLTAISKWRLAFLREQHLWGNWKRKNVNTYSLKSDDVNILLRTFFLSNNLLVIWWTRRIQVWDVSVFPATLVAAVTGSSCGKERWINCSVLDSNRLLLEKITCVQVFLVDVINKSIMLKHEIPLHENRNLNFVVTKQVTSVEGNVILGVSASDLYLSILDLENGKKLLEEPLPMMKTKHGNAYINGIKTCPTSDDVLVTIQERDVCYHYIYSLQQKLFLPGPIAVNLSCNWNVINKHYVAFGGLPSMTILDYHTSEVVFENKDQEKESVFVQAYKDSFIFVERKSEHCWLNIFSLTNKTIITVLQYLTPNLGTGNCLWPAKYFLKIVNHTFVVLFGRIGYIKREDNDAWVEYMETSITFQSSGQSLKRTGFFLENCAINKTCTRGASEGWGGISKIYCYW